MTSKLNRRHTLLGLAIGPVAWPRAAAAAESETTKGELTSPAPAEQPAGTCTLVPQAVEGPFYFDPKLVRSGISEGRPGHPLQLTLVVIEQGPCTPITNARVDIWHADASGIYSGYSGQGDTGATSTKGQSYLRGTQLTDTGGRVTFQSIYPGWYPGRTPHIHVKVFLDSVTLLTGQIYFPDDLSARIYREGAAYLGRGGQDTTNARDFIFRAAGKDGGGTVLATEEQDGTVAATLTIAVDRTGAAAIGGWLRDWW